MCSRSWRNTSSNCIAVIIERNYYDLGPDVCVHCGKNITDDEYQASIEDELNQIYQKFSCVRPSCKEESCGPHMGTYKHRKVVANPWLWTSPYTRIPRGGVSLFFRRKVGYPRSGVSPKGIPRPQGIYPREGYTLLQNFGDTPTKVGDTPTIIGDTPRKCQLLPYFDYTHDFPTNPSIYMFSSGACGAHFFLLHQSWYQLKTQNRYTN